MENKIKKRINERKAKIITELINLVNNNRVLMIASIKNLPDKQFQSIKKELRDKAIIKVIKKNLIKRAFEKKPELKDLERYLKENIVLIFSKEDPFELSLLLCEKKNPVKAKVGQIANEDIYIEPGPTELVPGPIISELGNAKIKFAIENGKIVIKERSLVVKKGEVIDENKASLLSKFDIKPFYVGLTPIVAYDSSSKKIYENIIINKKEILENLKEAFGKAFGFALRIGYICKETIKQLLAKAKINYLILEKFIKDKESENKNEQNINEKKDNEKNTNDKNDDK